MEGRVLGRVFSSLLAEGGLSSEVAEVISVLVATFPETTEGFAFCLSEKSDLLSQWRAYGQNGSGIALGFSAHGLIADYGDVNFGSRFYELKKVDYGEENLRNSLRPLAQEIGSRFAHYGVFARLIPGVSRESAVRAFGECGAAPGKIFEPVGEGAMEIVSRLLDAIEPLHFRIYDTKPASFHEECEWRLLRFLHKAALPEVEYSADDSSIRPFVSCPMAGPSMMAIKEVILGPRHKSSLSWVKGLLDTAGMSHVTVRRSTIESYR